MLKATVILLFFGTILSVFGQVERDYFDQINANYLTLKSMEVELKYELYRGASGSELLDEYSTILRTKEDASYRKMYNEEVITNGDKMVVIDHGLKTIQLSNYYKTPTELIDKQLKENLKYCKDITLQENEGLTAIRLNFEKDPAIPYGLVEIVIDEAYWINEITFYYTTQMNFSQDSFNPDYDYPKLKVTYLELKKKWKDKEGLTELERYVEFKEGIYHPASAYNTYEIINTLD